MSQAMLSLLGGAALKGTAVVLALFSAAFLLRRAAPALRHALWLAALESFLIFPVLGMVLPHVSITSPISAWQPATAPVASAKEAAALPGGASGLPTADARAEAALRAVRFTPDWTDLLLAAWACGAFFLLLRLGLASLGLRRMVQQGVPLGGPQHDRANALAAVVLRGRRVQFLQARSCTIPLTMGTLSPRVVLPPSIAADDGESLHAVLAHELAHVRRCDALTGRFAYVACCLFWFVPFAWLALTRLRVEQEKACDDEALSVCTERSGYARLLVRLGAQAQKPSLLALLSAQAAGIRTLEERIRSIMRGPGGHGRRGRRPLPLPVLLLVGVLLVPLSMMRCAPATSASLAAKEAAASTLPEVRLVLVWNSGTTTVAPNDTLTTQDFPMLWPIGPAASAPQKRRGTIVGVFAAASAHGIDVGGEAGWPVVAAGKGTVREAGSTADYGNYLVVDHASGFSTLYGNLSEASPLKAGNVVAAGQAVGALGAGEKPHFRFAVFLAGESVDPREILDGTMKAVSTTTTPSPLAGMVFIKTRVTVERFSGTGFTPDHPDSVSATGVLSTSTVAVLQWPTKGDVGVITNRFGPWINPFTRRAVFHSGIDIAWAEGWNIVAALPGTVTETGYSDVEGTYVRLSGDDPAFGTFYSHLASVKVKKGDVVTEGQVIAEMGSTGLSTGPHVHFEATYNGVAVDPLRMLPPESTLKNSGRGG